ncbi:helix-turn-helix transcriptional regulator [Streptomyces sp. NPDC091972]|uniref:helix-turn-helix transcriptional regulator n=1 Tax=Streptomyces sp. NPDC091972 TaxID=3366007 RepID=UPI0037FBFD63
MSTEGTQGTPCPAGLGLLQPDVRAPRRAGPALALRRLLRGVEDRITGERRWEKPTAVFASPVGPDSRYDAVTETPTISVLSGPGRIGRAVHRAGPDTSGEVLTGRRQTGSPAGTRAEALVRDQALLDRGGRIRALDQVTRRLTVVDREIAPGPVGQNRTRALEIRHPVVAGFLAAVLDRRWRPTAPRCPEAVPARSGGVTSRRRAGAGTADRPGTNTRTARVRTVRLAAAPGGESRAHPGAESGIPEQEGVTE